MLFIMPLFIGIPLGFLFLPVSRKRSKVRWRHIARVTVYSLSIPLVLIYILVVPITLGMVVDSLEDLAWFFSFWMIFVGLWVALLITWVLAIGQYLKIPHGWLIAPTLAILFFLVELIVMTLVGGFLFL